MDLDMTALGDEETLGMILAYLVPKVCISLIARPETLELLLQFAELELQVAALYAHRCCLRFWTILPIISFLLMVVAWLLGCCLAVVLDHLESV
ncbi:hypothetical protein LXL04_034864 [Taraxacum kok-saghyz]